MQAGAGECLALEVLAATDRAGGVDAEGQSLSAGSFRPVEVIPRRSVLVHFQGGATLEIPDDRVDLVRVAVAVEGLPTLLLPSEQVTAVHEAGHAVLHAAQDHRPSVMRIWPDRVGQGYAGACDFPLEVPALHLHPLHQPHQALVRACVTLAD